MSILFRVSACLRACLRHKHSYVTYDNLTSFSVKQREQSPLVSLKDLSQPPIHDTVAWARLVTFVYVKFAQILILKVEYNNSINGLQCYSFIIYLSPCYRWDMSNGSWGLLFFLAGTNCYTEFINGYNSYTCYDSDIVTVQPQNLPLRYYPVRTNGHTQVVRPRNKLISIEISNSW